MNELKQALRQAVGMEGLSPAEAAKMLGCSKRTIYRDLNAGRFPNAEWKNSRVVRIPVRDIEEAREKDRLVYAVGQ